MFVDIGLDSATKVIPNGEEPIQMQAPLNVQHLTFSTSIHPNEFYGIAFLLNSCPHLSTLTLMLGEGSVLQVSSLSSSFALYSFCFASQNSRVCL